MESHSNLSLSSDPNDIFDELRVKQVEHARLSDELKTLDLGIAEVKKQIQLRFELTHLERREEEYNNKIRELRVKQVKFAKKLIAQLRIYENRYQYEIAPFKEQKNTLDTLLKSRSGLASVQVENDDEYDSEQKIQEKIASLSQLIGKRQNKIEAIQRELGELKKFDDEMPQTPLVSTIDVGDHRSILKNLNKEIDLVGQGLQRIKAEIQRCLQQYSANDRDLTTEMRDLREEITDKRDEIDQCQSEIDRLKDGISDLILGGDYSTVLKIYKKVIADYAVNAAPDDKSSIVRAVSQLELAEIQKIDPEFDEDVGLRHLRWVTRSLFHGADLRSLVAGLQRTHALEQRYLSKTHAGMAIFLGALLVVGSILANVFTLGIATPVAAVGVTVGASLIVGGAYGGFFSKRDTADTRMLERVQGSLELSVPRG